MAIGYNKIFVDTAIFIYSKIISAQIPSLFARQRESFRLEYRLTPKCLQLSARTQLDFAQRFARFVNERNIEQFMNEFALAEAHIEQNANAKYVFLDLMLKINELLKLNMNP